MNNKELANKAIDIAKNYKTLYVMGCFGAPMTAANKKRYENNNAYNKNPVRTKMIEAATADTFGFDCVCLIKGILWGWNGDKNKVYGGATYASNGVPDCSTEGMITMCNDVSTDFSKIEVGEMLWLKGHAGIYIGNGLAVECTPKWQNKVQITAVGNIGKKSGYNSRSWTKHGKLPWVEYINDVKPDKENETVEIKLDVLKKGSKGAQVKTLQRILKEIGYSMTPYGVDGDFGNMTLLAVKDYQKRNGITVDGVVGKNTWDKLLKG